MITILRYCKVCCLYFSSALFGFFSKPNKSGKFNLSTSDSLISKRMRPMSRTTKNSRLLPHFSTLVSVSDTIYYVQISITLRRMLKCKLFIGYSDIRYRKQQIPFKFVKTVNTYYTSICRTTKVLVSVFFILPFLLL